MMLTNLSRYIILNFSLIPSVFLITIFILLNSAVSYSQGMILGTVTDAKTKLPLKNANVVLLNTLYGSATDDIGNYIIKNIPVGKYQVEVSYVGYEPTKKDIDIRDNISITLDFSLKQGSLSISEIIVTPGHFSVMNSTQGSKLSFTKENIKSTALYGGDIARSVTSLPGITGNDYSAKFNIRGGEHDEIIVMFDGIELYEPFHQKDAGSILSIVPVEAIWGVDLLTGGFPAEYGKRKSGVFNMRSETSGLSESSFSVGLSAMNGRFMAEGPVQYGEGRWFFSIRRGFADMAFKIKGEADKILPKYYDILAKIDFKINDKNRISLHFLRAGDHLKYTARNYDESESAYGDTYLWTKLNSIFKKNIYAQTVLSTGLITNERTGRLFDVFERFKVDRLQLYDKRQFYFLGFKQDWNVELSNWMLLKTGIDTKLLSADYTYSLSGREIENGPADRYKGVEMSPSGTEFSGYISGRNKIFNPLAIEYGVRYDSQTYTDDQTFSPRINASLALSKNTVLKFGWGEYYQNQGINELGVKDNDLVFHKSEKSIHNVIGFEHNFDNGINFRIEGYRKELSNYRLRYKNVYNTIDFYEELSGSRITFQPKSGKSEGVEVFIKKDKIDKFTWWTAYSFGKAIDDLDGIETPKTFDQTHTFDINLNYRPDDEWRFNLAWIYHTGWPYSNLNVDHFYNSEGEILKTEIEQYNGERISDYHRMDIRISRDFKIQDKGTLGAFIEFINLYNRKNIRDVEFFVGSEEEVLNEHFNITETRYYAKRENHYWISFIPSVGLTYDW